MCANNINCLKQISSFLQVPTTKIDLNNEKMPTCNLNNKTITGFVNIIFTLLEQTKSDLIGTNLIEETEIRQWLEYCVTYASQYTNSQNSIQILQELNNVLIVKTFFVGNSMTIADVALFYVLQELMKKLSHLEKEKYLNLSRWYDNIQQNNSIRNSATLIDFSTIFLSCFTLK